MFIWVNVPRSIATTGLECCWIFPFGTLFWNTIMHPVEHELLERRSAPQQDDTQRWPWPGGVPSTRDYVKHSAVVGEVSCAVDPARQRGGPVRDAEHGDVRALSAKAFQQLELASAGQVGYIGKARHIFKVCSSAHAGGSEVKQVYHAREIRLKVVKGDCHVGHGEPLVCGYRTHGTCHDERELEARADNCFEE